MIEIEPHPNLIEYFNITSTFSSNLTIDVFSKNDEHYNVVSNIDQNIFLLNKLQSSNLLLEQNNVCDCGLGLGFALYEIYLQSLDINKEFTFTGIEKQKVYVDFVKTNLFHLWEGNLFLIEDDIMNHNYSRYNLVYSYSPFNKGNKLLEMYKKISSEISTGSIIVENANSGLGHFNLLETISDLEKTELEDIFVFRKK